jgi:hypothetical protein
MRREIHAVFWSGKLKDKINLRDLVVDDRTMLKWFIKK